MNEWTIPVTYLLYFHMFWRGNWWNSSEFAKSLSSLFNVGETNWRHLALFICIISCLNICKISVWLRESFRFNLVYLNGTERVELAIFIRTTRGIANEDTNKWKCWLLTRFALIDFVKAYKIVAHWERSENVLNEWDHLWCNLNFLAQQIVVNRISFGRQRFDVLKTKICNKI